METAELDVALEELELRLERLRALYEQYFMGLEKIEPSIARKDVDRRIYVLRREKIRNTAKRFKLQTIIQRYNTFQQYWQRICREIENGTYKRHLLKVQKNNPQLLTIAARKRLGRAGRTSQPPEGASPSQPPSTRSAPASAPPAAAAPSTRAPAPEPTAAAVRPLGAPPLPRRPPLPPRGAAGAPPAQVAAAPATVPAAAPAAARPAAPANAPAKFESLDLDMDFMGDWDPGATRAPATKPTASATKPVAPTAKPVAPARPLEAPPAAPAARPAAARPASVPPAPVATPPRPASMRPPNAPARPLALRIPPSPRIPAAPAEPPRRAPAPAAVPKPALAAAPKPAASAASAGSVDDARLRDLHARLQQAKQQTKEANVSYEGLAKSIRATEAKLREQHKNRKIDFDVVIKDGKAVVKPIVR